MAWLGELVGNDNGSNELHGSFHRPLHFSSCVVYVGLSHGERESECDILYDIVYSTTRDFVLVTALLFHVRTNVS